MTSSGLIVKPDYWSIFRRARGECLPSLEGGSGIGGVSSPARSVAMTTLGRIVEEIGERAGTRTQDLQIKSPLLYQLSYALAVRGSAPRGGPVALGAWGSQ